MKDKNHTQSSYIAAIIILYHPDLNELLKAISNLKEQVQRIILVDNSNIEIDGDFINKCSSITNKVSYRFNNNVGGIAKAQNVGIKMALEFDSDYVMILDQDSQPTDNMVSQLLEDSLLLSSFSIKLAAIGPEHINKQTGEAYKPRVIKRKHFEEVPHILKVSEIMSSGSLIHKDVFKEIGLMDEQLFIDAVDHEWCWRAKDKGYICAISKKAKLHHMLGEGDRKFLGVNVAIASSFRVFYQYRNFIYLCSIGYVPLYWKLNNAFKYTVKFFYFPIFLSDGREYFTNMIKGIKAGFKMKKK